MKTIGVLCFSLALALLGSAFAAEPLTNETIVAMVKAGLSDELIIMQIKTSPTKFDVSPEKLMQLKQEGVPDTVLMMMMGAKMGVGQTIPPGQTGPVQTDVMPPMMGAPGQMQSPGMQPGYEEAHRQARLDLAKVVVMQDGKKEKMEETTAKIAASVGQAFKNVLLFNPTRKAALIVSGQRSQFKITENPPVFYVRENPQNVYGIGKFTVDTERDIRYLNIYSRMGVSTWETEPENTIKYTVGRETEGMYPRYKMTPNTILTPGEYLLYKLRGTADIFEFTIER